MFVLSIAKICLIIIWCRTCNLFTATDSTVAFPVPDQTSLAIMSSGSEIASNHPDTGDSSIPRFSFAAGDFTSIYDTADNVSAWDSVVTCFFLDTAPVVME